ncbi:NADH-quinone oxidoreductase subunit M [Thermostilla marina]
MGNLLAVTILLPTVGAALIDNHRCRARGVALVVSLVVLAASIVILAGFPGGAEPYAVWQADWLGDALPQVDLKLAVGLDGLSLWLFGLSALLTVTSVLVSWNAIEENAPTYYRLLLLLETGMLGVFAARDLLLFYVFFEFTLIPLFFLIGVWGSDQRRYAAVKFFLFTLAGSLLTFVGLLALVLWAGQYAPDGKITFDIAALTETLQQLNATGRFPAKVQLWIFLALFVGFAVKVPLFPLHTWLPLAHVEAPTAGSVLLAGVLLKVGGYGFVRFSMPMLPDAVTMCAPWIVWLAVVGIIYGALTALAQSDIKRLIAYSSVSHLGFCMLGFFALNRVALSGGVLQMINHGLSTGGLFAVVGMLYERYHTRRIRDYGGMASRLPVLAFFMFVMTFSSIGLPGLNGFAGEFLILLGTFQSAWAKGGHYLVAAVLAVGGVVLGAWYMLYLVRRVFFGALVEPKHDEDDSAEPVRDLRFREWCALVPLVVLIVWIGVCPQFFLSRMQPTLEQIYAAASVNEPVYRPPTVASESEQGEESDRPGRVESREPAGKTLAGTYLAQDDGAATSAVTNDR